MLKLCLGNGPYSLKCTTESDKISFSNVIAGKSTTDEELEEMLDGGNAAVFTAGVCVFP